MAINISKLRFVKMKIVTMKQLFSLHSWLDAWHERSGELGNFVIFKAEVVGRNWTQFTNIFLVLNSSLCHYSDLWSLSVILSLSTRTSHNLYSGIVDRKQTNNICFGKCVQLVQNKYEFLVWRILHEIN